MSAATPGVALEGVWKRFRRGERHDSLRELIPALARRALGGRRGPEPDEFWALRDVSLEVGPGEAVGIIGPNGAGKSTLLKLVSGILRPDRGRVAVRGRVGALIELFAGFHHELTGRENIFLQGAVMGMSRQDVRGKFDRIVSFAGIGDFLDTPIKRYSSGMQARLGFAVAAHLDPDVLVVDEVLAVGDVRFQRRATRRMREIAASGVPLLVVSHDLHRVVEFCDRALLLEAGEVVARGRPAECVAAYVGEDGAGAAALDCPVVPEAISEAAPPMVAPGDRVRLTVEVAARDPARIEEAAVGVRVRSLPGEELLFAGNSWDLGLRLPEGDFTLEVDLRMSVPPGSYRIQAVTWRLDTATEWARGPSTTVEVGGGARTYGPVFLDPRMALRDG